MNLKQLPYFVSIAETGSLSAAARRSGVSQPAISNYLQELERELQIALFRRVRGRMEPTEAGRIYLEMARQVLALQADAQALIGARGRQKKQVIRVGISPHRGAQALAAAYPQFARRFPDIGLQPVESYAQGVLTLLQEGKTDLSFATAGQSESGGELHFLPLHREEIVLALPSFHRLAFFASRDVTQAPRLALEEFRDTPFVMMSPSSTVGQVSRHLFAQSGFEPVSVFESSNVIMVTDMIRAGSGAGLIPAYYALPSDKMVYFRLKQPGYLTFSVVWRADRQLSEAERYLIYLKERLYDRKQLRLLNEILPSEEFDRIAAEFEQTPPEKEP